MRDGVGKRRCSSAKAPGRVRGSAAEIGAIDRGRDVEVLLGRFPFFRLRALRAVGRLQVPFAVPPFELPHAPKSTVKESNVGPSSRTPTTRPVRLKPPQRQAEGGTRVPPPS